MRRYEHRSYAEYRDGQIRKNLTKFARVFILPEEVRTIAARVPRPVRFGLCHGVRNGWEVLAFRRALGCDAVLGTDISPSAARVEGCLVWDFHEVHPDWVGRTDFVYSNALDHSYDPELCLARWVSCLSPRGVCVINWHKGWLSRVDAADCFSARPREVAALITRRHRLAEVVRVRDRTLFFVRAAGPAP